MYKVKKSFVPSFISDLFHCNTRKYNLRKADDFSLPRFNTIKYGKYSLRYTGPFLWSKLQRPIKLAESVRAIKRQIRKLHLTNIKSNHCNDCYLCNN